MLVKVDAQKSKILDALNSVSQTDSSSFDIGNVFQGK